MAASLSKRQQARNERALQDLIKSVPGNNLCADCQARNPGWASWSLGIFLCMRCAALHRKLGTHITKVKSLSMDAWSNDQVEHMKRVGNTASNRIYNPKNTKPPIPIDVDEADAAMERFIRQKYQERGRAVEPPMRHNTGSTTSDDHPPPLPPKTGSRFGFRSTSSIFPISSKARREAGREAIRHQEFEANRQRDRSPSPPPRTNKPSRIFGTTVGSSRPDDFESKMAELREMGFKDEKRNMTVLKGLDGDMVRTVESLVRIADTSASADLVRPGDAARTSSRSRTPVGPAVGLSINRTRASSPPQTSTNPFDMLETPSVKAQPSESVATSAQPQSQAMGNTPYQNPNPFGLMPSQSQYSLNQAFQSMAVSTSQPLFPHHTGGFPAPQQSHHHQLYQQSMTPPVPSIPQQYYPSVIYENPAQQPQQNNNYNPFMQQQLQQQTFQPLPTITTIQNNPYTQQHFEQAPQQLFHSPMEQSPQSPQFPQVLYGNGVQQSTQQANPFFNQMNPQLQNRQQPYDYQQQQPQERTQFQQYRPQTYPLVQPQTLRADKRSILDLYNYPQMTPTLAQQSQNQNQEHSASLASQTPEQQQRSVSSPLATHLAGSRNPFMSSGGGNVPSQGGDSAGGMGPFGVNQNGGRHVTQDSISVDAGGWQNGRHSPDAWGTISARSMQ